MIYLTNFIVWASKFQESIIYGLLGLIGTIVDILLYNASGKEMPRSVLYASLISGPIIAITASSLIGTWLGLDMTKSGVAGLCAYMAGMWARKFSMKMFSTDVPWFPKKDTA